MRKTTQRIPLRDLGSLNADELEIVNKNSIDGKVYNVFRVMANHVRLLKRWTPFAGYFMTKQTLSSRDRELLILRVGWHTGSAYVWEQHLLLARALGFTDAQIERIKQGTQADWDDKDAALMRAVADLFKDSVLSDATWEALSRHYSTEQIMDTVFTIGQYALSAWALNSFGVPLDDFLKQKEDTQ